MQTQQRCYDVSEGKRTVFLNSAGTTGLSVEKRRKGGAGTELTSYTNPSRIKDLTVKDKNQ